MLSEFYRLAPAFNPGDDVWRRLDASINQWRRDVLAALGPGIRTALHQGASTRTHVEPGHSIWPDGVQVIHIESDTAAAAAVEQNLRDNDVVNFRVETLALTSGNAPRHLSKRIGELHRRRWIDGAEAASAGEDLVVSDAVGPVKLAELMVSYRPDVVVLDEGGLVGEALLSLDADALSHAPLFILSTGEQSWTLDEFSAATAHLKGLGYDLVDPSGYTLSFPDDFGTTLSWFAAAVPSEQAFPKQSDEMKNLIQFAYEKFRVEVRGRRQMKVIKPAPFTPRVEVVSLETAAKVSGLGYASEPLNEQAFDINTRQATEAPAMMAAARFGAIDVVPKGAWKVVVDKRYYIEDVGYSGRSSDGLFGITSFPEFGGRWTAVEDAALIEMLDVPENAVLFGGDPAYYHWIMNWLPRLRTFGLIDRLVGRLEKPNFIVSDRLPARYFDFFDLLLDRPYEVTRLPERGVWRIDNVIVPSFFSSNELNPSISTWYRSKLGIGPQRGGRRYFLSRSDARDSKTPRRKVQNEVEVIEALKPYGFEPLLLEGRSAQEQIDLFSNADFVIGPHGAAFANMQFTPPGARAIVLENEWNHTFMMDMLIQAGHDAEVVMCRDVINHDFEADFTDENGTVDPEIRRSRDMLVDIQSLIAALDT
ncbi:glycosyltransferase family 61 protein [Henriciella mobilis]|uniref:Glycosyltransferase family 61 protein n=2 Tax=Henriciella mobilis TaxID=2305467 RepID=A0A399RQX9_9PROT|nr:glycosyltransferase family 61 protein [Henriciella mobilis]